MYLFFRANPSPKVTDLACRLPLPTFFYHQRLFTSGTCCGAQYGTRPPPLSPLAFHATLRHSRHEHPSVLFRGPSASPLYALPQTHPVSQKRHFFPEPVLPSPGSLASPLRGRVCQNINWLPFRAEIPPLSRITAPLRPDSPGAHCASPGTFPLFSPQGSSLNTCYSHQDLHCRLVQARSHAPFRPTHTPSYWLNSPTA